VSAGCGTTKQYYVFGLIFCREVQYIDAAIQLAGNNMFPKRIMKLL
jgi:hypothetical protein